jgi:hydroxymethylglutaryl-CoA reductase (NADPH)
MDETNSQPDSGFNSPPETTSPQVNRTFDESVQLYKLYGAQGLGDGELVDLTLQGIIPFHSLEKVVQDCERAVKIRRLVVSQTAETRSYGSVGIFQLPYKNYDFSRLVGSCTENVIGYVPVPVGVAGPLNVDGRPVFLPMATTEGTLIASTSRGCKAINASGGVNTVVTDDSMSRAPCVCFDNIALAAQAKRFIDSGEGQEALRAAFDATTRFGKLQNVSGRMVGSSLYLRFRASTGEAMGMNIIGKGVEAALQSLREDHGFSHMKILSLSSNYCTDKKPAAVNWIEGRGKSVVAEAVIAAPVVQRVLKCSVSALVKLNTKKNLVGSALAGMAAGGFNAHAANIVTAIFIATGQDPAQNVVSSNCITIMEECVLQIEYVWEIEGFLLTQLRAIGLTMDL